MTNPLQNHDASDTPPRAGRTFLIPREPLRANDLDDAAALGQDGTEREGDGSRREKAGKIVHGPFRTLPHERTKIGRRYSRAALAVTVWIEAFRWCAAPEAIRAAENLKCALNLAAWNGLALRRDELLGRITEMDRLKGAQAIAADGDAMLTGRQQS